MPYITFRDYPNVPGREYRNAAIDPSTGAWVAEVDEALPGESVITEDAHGKTVARAEQAYRDVPPAEDVAVEPQPSRLDLLEARMDAFAQQAGIEPIPVKA